ncbi:hypothetical protein D918_07691 [Trichuris suis]|nr:hypothetical protein D918_07691 [Trichuris suis]
MQGEPDVSPVVGPRASTVSYNGQSPITKIDANVYDRLVGAMHCWIGGRNCRKLKASANFIFPTSNVAQLSGR